MESRQVSDILESHIHSKIAYIIHRFAIESKQILKDNIIEEYLFGSYTTNTYTPHSDIDILILVNTLTPEIRRQMSVLASDYMLEYDVFISPVIKDYQVWKKNKKYNSLLYQHVLQHGIQL
jgi:predicted nucleotidyltransferase